MNSAHPGRCYSRSIASLSNHTCSVLSPRPVRKRRLLPQGCSPLRPTCPRAVPPSGPECPLLQLDHRLRPVQPTGPSRQLQSHVRPEAEAQLWPWLCSQPSALREGSGLPSQVPPAAWHHGQGSTGRGWGEDVWGGGSEALVQCLQAWAVVRWQHPFTPLQSSQDPPPSHPPADCERPSCPSTFPRSRHEGHIPGGRGQDRGLSGQLRPRTCRDGSEQHAIPTRRTDTLCTGG